MKIKCPGCQTLLQVPDSAAGKVIKCPCGKQLRAPGGVGASPNAGAAKRPAVPAGSTRPAPVAPTRPTPPRPTPAGPSGSPSGFDNSIFDDLTDQDLEPIKSVVPQAARKGTGGPKLGGLEKEQAESQSEYKTGAAKEVYSSIGILLFLGILRVCFNAYFLMNVDAEVEGLGLDPDFEGETDTLLKLIKAVYIINITIGAVFLACASLIFKFPLTCAITALVTYVISEIIGLILNPLGLFSIGGWVARVAIFGGLVQTVNNASYFKFVKAGGRG